MTPTETVSPLVLLPSATPPDSPISSPAVALDDEQAKDMASAPAAMRIAPTTPYCHCCSCQPPSGTTTTSETELLQFAKRFLDVVNSLSTAQGPPPPAQADEVKSRESTARASKLEFKTVNEVWDVKAYKYKIVESLTSPDEENKLDQYIFIVRTRIEKKTEKQIHYIDIKSESLRDILRSVLRDVGGICLGEQKPSVEQNLLFHYLSDLEAYRSNNAALDLSTVGHLDLLVEFIKTTYKSTTERLAALLERHEITYDCLWALFKPNAIIYTACDGTCKSRGVKFDFGEERKRTNGTEYFYMGCRYLDSDGKVFGEVSTALGIEKFRGSKPISSLKAFPLSYHPKEKEMRVYLERCGRKFLSLMNVHHCEYRGMAFIVKKNRPIKIFVNSRIMVDAAYFREANPNYARPSIDESNKNSSNNDWVLWGEKDSSEKLPDVVKSNGMEPANVEGDGLLICSPTVLGFSLGIKLWLEFAVDDLRDIEWQPEALQLLQIPQKKKRAISALLEAHLRRALTNSLRFDDLIAGKGLGFNVLLYGPPGTGKTLTAEALSEHFQMTLYAVSSGELGGTAEDLEERLPLIFERASRWNALLLLDEVDVFLEKRLIGDIYRNALVCVFLRTLEYYQGIMFFTTNRVEQIDGAIASRIHFKIKYDDLGLDQRMGVWEHFLGKAITPQGAPVRRRSDIESLALKKRNGREIKNLVSTAHALALQEKAQVTMSHLEFAIEAGENFESDIGGAGQSDSLNLYT